MEIIIKGISRPFDKHYVDVMATGEVDVNQSSKLKTRVKNNNIDIGITDNNFCLVLEKDTSVTRITLNPQNKDEIVFTAYYKDEEGHLHKKEEYAIIDFVEEKTKKAIFL